MVDHKKPKACLLHATPLAVSEVASRMCYDSFAGSENNIVKFFKHDPEHFINTAKDEDIPHSDLLYKLTKTEFHTSVLEHISLSYYIKDVPRNVVIEANRHRIGIATTQKSTRFTIGDLVDAWLRKDIFDFHGIVKNNVSVTDSKYLEELTSYLWESLDTLNTLEPLEADIKGSRKKAQNDRVKFILPECWVLEGVWTFNLRSLKHFLELRKKASAYYGIQEMAESIIEVTPKKYLDLIGFGK